MDLFHGTTILSVRRGARVALGGDGQVTLGNVVIKATARKVRRIYNDRVLAGFAGATARWTRTVSIALQTPGRCVFAFVTISTAMSRSAARST